MSEGQDVCRQQAVEVGASGLGLGLASKQSGQLCASSCSNDSQHARRCTIVNSDQNGRYVSRGQVRCADAMMVVVWYSGEKHTRVIDAIEDDGEANSVFEQAPCKQQRQHSTQSKTYIHMRQCAMDRRYGSGGELRDPSSPARSSPPHLA